MPKRRAEDTPGMVMTDHRIQRRPPSGLLTQFRERPPEQYHGEVAPYYPRPLPATPANKLYNGVAQVALENNLQAGLPDLAREVASQKPREPQFYVVLGDAWQNAGKPREAVAAYEEAVRLNPKSLPAILSLAGGLAAAGEPARAAEVLQRAVQLSPADPILWYRQGMLDFASGRLSDAMEKIRRAITLDPSLPDQSRSLGEVLAKAGQPYIALPQLG
jgi:tetratricopeptide (TPR) repeat protein